MPLQAQQIVSLACIDAKAKGYTVQAGMFLTMILSDLCQQYDFELARKTFYFNFNPGLTALVGNSIFGSGPYPLPADFLRVADDVSFFWTLDGVTYFMVPFTQQKFDMQVQQPGNQSYPDRYSTDLSLGDATQQGLAVPSCYVYPPPSGAYPATLRYFCQMPDIANPETSAAIPWFPNQRFLRKRLAAMLMGETGDDREAQWESDAMEILDGYLIMKDDPNNKAKYVRLDRNRFGRGSFDKLKNTKAVGW